MLATWPLFSLAQTPVITVAVVPDQPRLVNLAVRSTLAANETLITGFVVSDTSNTTVLARASGPALTPLGVSGAMPNPRLQIIDSSGRVVAENDDWGTAAPNNIQFASVAAGAFPLPSSSRDAAAIVTLGPGAYTLVISGSTGADSGVVLGEIYDAPFLDPTAERGNKAPSRLVNLSVRGRVTASSNVIGGFVLASGVVRADPAVPNPPRTRRCLIRVVGPALGGFGVNDAVDEPTLELAGTNGRIIATNDGWDADPAAAAAIREATSQVGAFPLVAGSRDAAIIATLTDGSYTVIARGANGSTGPALIEIYELEN